ncbi:MAG: TetR/AcrR family transcriptional regulator [Rhodobacter sp.]|nr:TetR/AcrR family transcriptional regulator [Rhodobacter sp.]
MDLDVTRKPHHHGRLPEAVIELAIDAARAGSIDLMSMRDVSRRLGVSPAAVYRHFPDREAILRAVARAGFNLLADRFETAVPYASTAPDAAAALERYQALAQAYVSFAREHYGLWRLMFGPCGRDPQAPKPARPSTYEWLGKALDELKAYGVITSATAGDQYFVWTAVHGFSDLQTSPAATQSANDTDVRRHAIMTLRALG